MLCGRVVCFLTITTVMCTTMQIPNIIMNNGKEIPAVGLGTYQGVIENNNATAKKYKLQDVISQAIDIGYRLIDTASIYNNEPDIGAGIASKIAERVVTRDDVFITTKLWNTHHKRDQVLLELRQSLTLLGTNYVDLFLMHWPMGLNEDYTQSNVDYMETWRGMEDAVNLGLAKSIGLSNFNMDQLKRVLREGTIKPAAIEIEVHLQNVQEEFVKYAQSEGVVVIGFSPFGSLVPKYGQLFPGPKADDPVLSRIANKYGKTAHQVVLRWLVDRKIVPIPKTVSFRRLQENINIFDFKLDEEEIEILNRFDSCTRYTLPSFWQDHPYYPFEKIKDVVENPFIKT